MSAFYSANQEIIVSEEYLKGLPHFDHLIELLEGGEGREEKFAYAIENDAWSEFDREIGTYDADPIGMFWKYLKEAFAAKHPGLELGFGFHDKRLNGQPHDQVNGRYFTVKGVYEYTPAAKGIAHHLKVVSYVTFG